MERVEMNHMSPWKWKISFLSLKVQCCSKVTLSLTFGILLEHCTSQCGTAAYSTVGHQLMALHCTALYVHVHWVCRVQLVCTCTCMNLPVYRCLSHTVLGHGRPATLAAGGLLSIFSLVLSMCLNSRSICHWLYNYTVASPEFLLA